MLIDNSKNPEIIRKLIVDRYYQLNKNASAAGREFQMKRQSVSFWVQRYESDGIEGLKNKSKAPHNIPHKTPAEIESKIKEIAKSKKCRIGQDRIQSELRKIGVHRSTSVINRVMNDFDLIKKRKRKYQKKKQIREYRKKLRDLFV